MENGRQHNDTYGIFSNEEILSSIEDTPNTSREQFIDDYSMEVVNEIYGYEPEVDTTDAQDTELETIKEDHEQTRLQKVRNKLGSVATKMGEKFRRPRTKKELAKRIGSYGIAFGVVVASAVLMDEIQKSNPDILSQIGSYFGESNNTTTLPVEVESAGYTTAERTIAVGGAGDKTSEGFKSILGNIHAEAISYPASIAPSGEETMRESIDAAIPKVSEIFREAEYNPDTDYSVHGYSLGSVAVSEGANAYTESGGEIHDNVSIDLYGSPLVENTGVFSGESATTVTEAMDTAGIVHDTELPQGADTHSFKTDFWSNAGDAPVTSQVSMFAGFASDGHNVPNEGYNAVLTGETEMSNGGVSHSYEHIEGPQNPILRTAEAHTDFSAEANPALTEFVDAVAPIGEVGSPDIPQIETYDVIDTGAAAIDEALVNHNHAPVAEQFVDNTGVENIAPFVEPVVEHLNQPIDLGFANTPEVIGVIEQVQEAGVHIPNGFDVQAEVNGVVEQVQELGFQDFQIPQW